MGEMHAFGISQKELAEELKWHPKYLSAVLSGRRKPAGAEDKVFQAIRRAWFRKDRMAHGWSGDLNDLIDRCMEISPEYAAKWKEILGIEYGER